MTCCWSCSLDNGISLCWELIILSFRHWEGANFSQGYNLMLSSYFPFRQTHRHQTRFILVCATAQCTVHDWNRFTVWSCCECPKDEKMEAVPFRLFLGQIVHSWSCFCAVSGSFFHPDCIILLALWYHYDYLEGKSCHAPLALMFVDSINKMFSMVIYFR